MWQNNASWKEGLFLEIPFKRFQAIKTQSKWDSPLAIFTRINKHQGNEWSNLRFTGIQSSSSPTISAFDTLFSPEYYVVAIDTRVRTTKHQVEIKTVDNIPGTVSVTIEYQVVSLEILFNIEDPLTRLKDLVGEKIFEFVSRKNFSSMYEVEMKKSLQDLETIGLTGIKVNQYINFKIEWADFVEKTVQKDSLDRLEAIALRDLNEIRIQKLRDFGISDPVLIASVLSRRDSDFNVIMDHVRNISQAYKDLENPIEIKDTAPTSFSIEFPLPSRISINKYYDFLSVITALDIVYVVFAILYSNEKTIANFLSSLKESQNNNTYSVILEKAQQNGIKSMQLVSIHYGSPASFDLLGIGKILEVLKDIIKDVAWKGKHEKKLSSIDEEKAKLEAGSKKIELEIKKKELEKISHENQKLALEVANQKLDLVIKARNLNIIPDDREILVAILNPRLGLIAEEIGNTPISFKKQPAKNSKSKKARKDTIH